MSPLFMRIFSLVGIALAAASMQLKARAETLPGMQARQVPAVPAQLERQAEPTRRIGAGIVAANDRRST